MKKNLSVFALTMITVAGIVNLRDIPLMATYGFASCFFYIIAALFFLLPSALICAELASMWRAPGGVYLWVARAFGARMGLLAIWLEWINNVISTPLTISFLAGGILYLFNPHYSHWQQVIVMLMILWGATFYNLLGVHFASRLNIIGAVLGTIIPALTIIALALCWIVLHQKLQISFSWQAFLPKQNWHTLVFFVSVLSSYAGVQIAAFHASDVKQPQRDFPRAIFFAVLIILTVTIFPTLALAIVVPVDKINFITGLLQGFFTFLHAFHLSWCFPILVMLILLSGFSTLSAWILGPARGLWAAAEKGHFPSYFARLNRFGAPQRIMILQAIIGSVLSLVFIFIQSFNSAFWLLLVATSQFTLLMYLLVFSALIRLRLTLKQKQAGFRIPGGPLSCYGIVTIAMLVCLLALLTSFLQPQHLIFHGHIYIVYLLFINLVFLILPLAYGRIAKPYRSE